MSSSTDDSARIAFYNSCDPAVTGEGEDWAYSTCTGSKKALMVRALLELQVISHLLSDCLIDRNQLCRHYLCSARLRQRRPESSRIHHQ